MNLSIVMPVYNEAAVIETVVAEIDTEIASRVGDCEIVAVDDGSTDATGTLLDEIGARYPRLRVHHFADNRGHGPALRGALERASGAWIFQIDADGQQVASEFGRLWERREHADLLMGVRTKRRNGPHRRLVSALAAGLARILGAGPLQDVNVPFKLFRHSVWADLEGDIPADPVAPSMLIAVGCGLRGWRVEQLPISHRPRVHSPSSIDLRALVRLSAGAARELVAFRRRVRRRGRLVAASPASSPTGASSQ